MSDKKPSQLAIDVARGVYADDAEMFQRDLNSLILGATSRFSNVNSWAQNQLRILSEMAAERRLEWVVRGGDTHRTRACQAVRKHST